MSTLGGPTIIAQIDGQLSKTAEEMCANPTGNMLYGRNGEFKGTASAASVKAGDPVFALPGAPTNTDPAAQIVSGFNCATQANLEQLYKQTALLGISVYTQAPGSQGGLVTVGVSGRYMVNHYGGDEVHDNDQVYIVLPDPATVKKTTYKRPKGVIEEEKKDPHIVYGLIKKMNPGDKFSTTNLRNAWMNPGGGNSIEDRVAAEMRRFNQKNNPSPNDAAELAGTIIRMANGGYGWYLGIARSSATKGYTFECDVQVGGDH